MAAAWQPAVRDAMFASATAEIGRNNQEGQAGFNYRWEHVTTVVTLALRLAGLVGADSEVVEAAAWLHDVAKTEGEDHAEVGAGIARNFLAKTDFPPEKIEAVVQAIAQHKGLWRDEPLESLEAKVLWDADKLSKMGLTAAFHWTGMKLAAGNKVTVVDLIANGREANWLAKTVASMHTEPARRAAEARLKAFFNLWNELEAELKGSDLVNNATHEEVNDGRESAG